MSEEKKNPLKIRWGDNVGKHLVKSVSIEWDQVYYFCKTCGNRIGVREPEAGWVCGMVDFDNFGREPCPGKEWTMGKIPMQDKHTSEEFEFWNAFSIPKAEARNTTFPAPVQRGNPFLASIPGPDYGNLHSPLHISPASSPSNPGHPEPMIPRHETLFKREFGGLP